MATKTKDYQELNLELDEVLAKLQQPNVQVDDAVKLYEQGLALIEQLEKQLATAENTIEKLKLAAVQAAKE
jgi:exodeoxyribonuclease VII small subunit